MMPAEPALTAFLVRRRAIAASLMLLAGLVCARPALAQTAAPAPVRLPTTATPPPSATPSAAPAATTTVAPTAATPTAPPAEPTPEAKERARSAYARGQAAFAHGDFAQAKGAFAEAFAAVPNPIVLLSVAESATKAGTIDEAIAAFDQYLQLRPDAADRVDVQTKRAALAAMPAQLSVVTEPPGADLLLDGQPTGTRSPGELVLALGDHQLKCALTGYESAVETIHATPGAHLERRIVLNRPIPPPVAVSSTPDLPLVPVTTPPAKLPVAALWVTGGIGAAGLIAGTVLGFLALKEHTDFNAKPTTASADRGERLALFADVGFGVGAMAVITAAVLYLTGDEPAPEPKAAAARLDFIPQLSPGSASATARLRF